jgi:CheY-like chemotaxis protein/GAF domain-containing protein
LLLTAAARAGWVGEPIISDNVARAETWNSALDTLSRESFDALVADLTDPTILETLRALHQAGHILTHAADGIAVVDFDLKIRWANPAFQRLCEGQAIGRGFYEALGSPEGTGSEFCPFHTALACRDDPHPEDEAIVCVSERLHCRDNRHLDIHITPLDTDPFARLPQTIEHDGPRFVALCHDATALVQKQQKLDALHRAGRELAALGSVPLANLDVAGRVELLKSNIRRLIRDLLHFEVIEIRLIERTNGRLIPLLQDGLTSEAATRELFARPEDNGVTGFVAATGNSYLCPDTLADSLYLTGASGARSSLTVPLRYADQIVGTLNVESPKPGTFGEEDLQFAEIFSHAVAAALHTLDLLSAEKTFGASQSIEAVNREVALPVDDILADATTLLERYVGHGPEVADRINKILANARLIKQSIVKVGEDLGTQPLPSAIRFPTEPVLKGIRVLVADNDDRVRRHAHQLIGRWGGIVETARDGQEALTMARLTNYDAIVADIRLPGLFGAEAYQALRQVRPDARVILMAGYGYDPGHSLVKARQEGLKHVLYKPFRVDQFRDALTGLGKDQG